MQRCLALLPAITALLTLSCGARPALPDDLDQHLDADAGIPLRDSRSSDGEQPDGLQLDATTEAAAPFGCIEGAVRLGPAVSCDPTAPGKDCRGTLCVDLFLVGAPANSPFARSCRPSVDLSAGKHAAFSVGFSAAKALPQATILVGAFLAEGAKTMPSGPAKGDPTLSVATVSYSSASHCPWLDLVLDERW